MAETLSPYPQDAILMAGEDPPNQSIPSLEAYKPLIEICGQTIIKTVFEALEQSQNIQRVFLVSPKDILNDHIPKIGKEVILIEPAGSFFQNLETASNQQQQMGGSNRILVVYSDLPFLQSQSLDWMVFQQNSPLTIPIVSRDDMQSLKPTYQTYYWPMKEFPFKWGDVTALDIHRFFEGDVKNLIDNYRKTWKSGVFLTTINRLIWLQKNGGGEAVYSLLINYISKFLQQKLHYNNQIPLSNLRTKADYEALLSNMLNVDTDLVKIPHIDVALDVDNLHRLGIFQRGYNEIKQVVAQSKSLP